MEGEQHMDRLQIIETANGEKLAVVPFEEYEALRVLAAQADDGEEEVNEATRREVEETMRCIDSGEEKTIPGDVVFAQLDGDHPVRAWRKYRKLTAEKLARKDRINRVYLAQIGNGKRKGTAAVCKALAKTLGCSVEYLIK